MCSDLPKTWAIGCVNINFLFSLTLDGEMSSGPFVKNKRNFTQPLSLRDGEGTLSTALSESPVLIIIRQGPWLTLQSLAQCIPNLRPLKARLGNDGAQNMLVKGATIGSNFSNSE